MQSFSFGDVTCVRDIIEQGRRERTFTPSMSKISTEGRIGSCVINHYIVK
jgi:hypothetical protein